MPELDQHNTLLLSREEVARLKDVARSTEQPIKPTKELTGGRVNYYLVNVTHPQREDQPPYQAECEDIIEVLMMTPDEANIFKAIWRSAAARQGAGKPDHKALYDAEKMVHYAGRNLRRLRRITSNVDHQPGGRGAA